MKIYQLNISIEGIQPTIWRRVLVSENLNFHYFHHVIQIAMGWYNYHLWEFRSGDIRIGSQELLDDHTALSDDLTCINHILKNKGSEIMYEYDFGDCWLHKIEVEDIIETDKYKPFPVLESGERACPPEDVGGFTGYETLIEAMRDTSHPEREEYIQWLDGVYNPEKFEGLYSINQALKGLREYVNRWNKD